MKHRPRGLLMAIAALVVLTGCSEPTPDKPTSPPPVTTAPATPTNGVPTSPPPIPRPLDASKFRGRACDLFTDEQARDLGYPLEKRSGVVPEESYCVRTDTSDLLVDFSIWYSHDGTDKFTLAHRRKTGDWDTDYSVSIMVDGQPALKLPGAGNCSVLIGLSTTESIKVHFSDKKVDFCERAVRIAEGVVRNIQAA